MAHPAIALFVVFHPFPFLRTNTRAKKRNIKKQQPQRANDPQASHFTGRTTTRQHDDDRTRPFYPDHYQCRWVRSLTSPRPRWCHSSTHSTARNIGMVSSYPCLILTPMGGWLAKGLTLITTRKVWWYRWCVRLDKVLDVELITDWRCSHKHWSLLKKCVIGRACSFGNTLLKDKPLVSYLRIVSTFVRIYHFTVSK